MGPREQCLQKGQGLSKGTSYRLSRILRGLHPLGNKKGTLAKPWPLKNHDFIPAPPSVPPGFVPSFCPDEQVQTTVRADLQLFEMACEEDEEVDLWAEGLAADAARSSS